MTTGPDTEGHDTCGSKKRAGGVCGLRAGWGTNHPGIGACKLHGGSTPQHKKHAAKVIVRRAAEALGLATDIDPGQAILREVTYKAREVEMWRGQVAMLEDDALTWSTTKREYGHGPQGPVDMTTEQADVPAAMREYHQAQRDLVAFSAAAIKGGVDERMVRLAESQGAQLVRIADNIVTGLLEELGASLPAEVTQRVITAAIDQEAA